MEAIQSLFSVDDQGGESISRIFCCYLCTPLTRCAVQVNLCSTMACELGLFINMDSHSLCHVVLTIMLQGSELFGAIVNFHAQLIH